MLFNQHSDLAGRHAFLSPSSYHWLNYDDHKLAARFESSMAHIRGSDLHRLAHEAIRLKIKLGKGNRSLATYVNDGIAYGMACEQTLFYSNNCFGTPDTISFNRNILRIHDLKTGITATSMKQLEVYAALFCLEYGIDPYNIRIILRIYQRDEIVELEPEPEDIALIMDKIVDADQQIERIREEDRW